MSGLIEQLKELITKNNKGGLNATFRTMELYESINPNHKITTLILVYRHEDSYKFYDVFDQHTLCMDFVSYKKTKPLSNAEVIDWFDNGYSVRNNIIENLITFIKENNINIVKRLKRD